jgi:hypothetical protein
MESNVTRFCIKSRERLNNRENILVQWAFRHAASFKVDLPQIGDA